MSDTVTKTVKGHDVILVLRDANFDVGKSVLRAGSARSRSTRWRASSTARRRRAVNITITGYTDSVGSDEYNMKLGMARAMSVQTLSRRTWRRCVAHGGGQQGRSGSGRSEFDRCGPCSSTDAS